LQPPIIFDAACWTVSPRSEKLAAPTTYAVNGEQYVAVQVGYGGTAIAEGPFPPSSAAVKYQNTNRIIAFKLGGGPVPTPAARVAEAFEKPPAQSAGQDVIQPRDAGRKCDG